MPNLTLKNIPEDLYRLLKKSAAEHRRSLNKEVIFRLERSLAATRIDPEEFLARVDALREKTDSGIPITDEWIRKARDAGRP